MTEQQLALLRFIERRIDETGVSPSFREMAAHLGYVSPSSVHRMLGNLERMGWIRRVPASARSVEVLKRAPETGKTRRLAAASLLLLQACEAVRDELADLGASPDLRARVESAIAAARETAQGG